MGLSRTTDYELSLQALRTAFDTHESVFYAIFLHILIFYLTAFMSGYLAERLNQQGRKLADTSSALRRAQLETDEILRHLNSGLLTVDARGCIIYFNRAAEKILGYAEDHVKGMHCTEVFAERMPVFAECLVAGVTHGLAYPRKEIQILSREGKHVPLGLSTSVLTEEDGNLRGVIAIFSDLTTAKTLESKVRANDRLAAIGELSASIAHEIRNPLAAISGSVEVLLKELALSDENERLMNLIIKESSRLNKILTDFLSYARMSQPVLTRVELCSQISDVIELLHRHKSIPDEISMSIESEDAVAYVIGDEDHIKQLLMNLAFNACEAFSDEHGCITFGVHKNYSGDTIDLVVEDNGPGIDPARIDKIYEPFYSTKKHGTGLGLAIVHRICNMLNLKIKIDSIPGTGTKFTVAFPTYSTSKNHTKSQSSETGILQQVS
jgi:two-component system sensor histidine kinase PilS (NtrC family)